MSSQEEKVKAMMESKSGYALKVNGLSETSVGFKINLINKESRALWRRKTYKRISLLLRDDGDFVPGFDLLLHALLDRIEVDE